MEKNKAIRVKKQLESKGTTRFWKGEVLLGHMASKLSSKDYAYYLSNHIPTVSIYIFRERRNETLCKWIKGMFQDLEFADITKH